MDTLASYSKAIFRSTEIVFKMISAGGDYDYGMFGSPIPKKDDKLLPDQYARFQAGIKEGMPGTPEAILTIVINKDNSGEIEIRMNLSKSQSQYSSKFEGFMDFKEELLIIESILKKNFIWNQSSIYSN